MKGKSHQFGIIPKADGPTYTCNDTFAPAVDGHTSQKKVKGRFGIQVSARPSLDQANHPYRNFPNASPNPKPVKVINQTSGQGHYDPMSARGAGATDADGKDGMGVQIPINPRGIKKSGAHGSVKVGFRP